MKVFDVIQFEGDPSVVVWKSPVENFNYGSQLIVDENHYAVLLIEGHTEVFGAGPHTLETQNLPFLGSIQNIATAGKTPFPCKVYFVNKTQTMDLNWGTDSKLQVMDPKYGLILNLRLHGNLSYCVGDSTVSVKKLMEKMSGFVTSFGSDAVVKKMRGIISSRVTDTVAKFFATSGIDFFTANAHLLELSEKVKEPLSQTFDDYGLDLTQFFMETMTTDNEDTAEFKQAKSAAMRTVTEAQAAAASRTIQGFTWQEQRQMDTLQTLANNQGTPGTFMGGMLGLGVSGQITQPFNNLISQNINQPLQGMGQAAANMGGYNPAGNAAQQQAPSPSTNPAAQTPAGQTVPTQASVVQQSVPPQPGTPGTPVAPAAASSLPISPTAPASAQQTQPQQQSANPVQAPAQPASGSACPSCGNAVQSGWVACPFCGTPLGKPKCPNCGNEVESGWMACPFCGTKLK
ncbi:SPFH domain-containing protein [Bifidobacterium boum]|uniref:SPFH domain-containing protein n=1 Tax=Bifidobacterium boum TaxID=78343 RepID=UPI003F9212BE